MKFSTIYLTFFTITPPITTCFMLTAYFNPIREKSHTHYRSFDLWLQSLEIRTNDEFQQFSPESSKTQIEQFINTVAEQSDLDDWEDVFLGCDTDYDQVLTSLESVSCINSLTEAVELYEPSNVDLMEQARKLFFEGNYLSFTKVDFSGNSKQLGEQDKSKSLDNDYGRQVLFKEDFLRADVYTNLVYARVFISWYDIDHDQQLTATEFKKAWKNLCKIFDKSYFEMLRMWNSHVKHSESNALDENTLALLLSRLVLKSTTNAIYQANLLGFATFVRDE